MADFFTVACRTGDEDSGMTGISLLLLEKTMPGIRVRKMKTQFDTTHGTTFINLEDVKVPVRNLIGQEGTVATRKQARYVLFSGVFFLSFFCDRDEGWGE